MRLVELALKKIDDDKHLSVQMAHSDAVSELIHNYNNVARERDNMSVVTSDTLGIDLKRHLAYLPAADLNRLLCQYLTHFPYYSEGDLVTETGEERRQSRRASDHPHKPLEDDEDKDGADQSETPATRDDRRFRHKVLLTMLIGVMILAFILVGAIIAIMFHNHAMPDSAVIKTLMNTAVEIIKILFPGSK